MSDCAKRVQVETKWSREIGDIDVPSLGFPGNGNHYSFSDQEDLLLHEAWRAGIWQAKIRPLAETRWILSRELEEMEKLEKKEEAQDFLFCNAKVESEERIRGLQTKITHLVNSLASEL